MGAAKTGGRFATGGKLNAVDATARSPLGVRVQGNDALDGAAEYIYLQGCLNCIVGSVVTYDHLGQATLIAANAVGPVAVSMGICGAAQFGWFAIAGTHPTDVVANSAAAVAGGKNPGFETTAGKVGDGRAAGDEINNFFQRVATTTAALALCQFYYPYVNDATGA